MKEIDLFGGQTTKIDDADYERLSKYHWTFDGRYAVRFLSRRVGQKKIYMHREILGVADGVLVDHADLDKLNNTRANLRECTRTENVRNQYRSGGTSQYRGVSWNKNRQLWEAQISVNKKHISLGCFSDEVEAAKEYDKAARKHFGRFAQTNFAAS